mgnify:CR=1 FL=1
MSTAPTHWFLETWNTFSGLDTETGTTVQRASWSEVKLDRAEIAIAVRLGIIPDPNTTEKTVHSSIASLLGYPDETRGLQLARMLRAMHPEHAPMRLINPYTGTIVML